MKVRPGRRRHEVVAAVVAERIVIAGGVRLSLRIDLIAVGISLFAGGEEASPASTPGCEESPRMTRRRCTIAMPLPPSSS